MTSISSESLSTVKNLRKCQTINHRIVALDDGHYRRQITHFEYYWGLQKGDIDLASPRNHIQLRQDMACRLKKREWVLLPLPETLKAMYCMSRHNETSGLQSRRRCFEELCEEEFEYEFVPLHILDRTRVTLYVDEGTAIKAVRAPFKSMPRIRSRAHPFFVTFMAFQQLSMTAALVMPVDQARAVLNTVGDIVWCWKKQPPAEFLVGPNVWQQHRHPLSDDGHEDIPVMCSSNKNDLSSNGKVRKTTQAPSKQRKATSVAKPYARFVPRPPRARQSAMPLTDVKRDVASSYDRMLGARPELHAWIADVASSGDSSAAVLLEDEAGHDEILARYRAERARDADNALDPLTNIMLRSGLIMGDGIDWSAHSSNIWAKRLHGVCLLGANPFGKAKKAKR
ncbi:hypothetical protein HDZ31DRAFT_48551 [Schizophyllum fasciatum]